MKRIYIICGVVGLMAGLTSCRGRHADDTPNGETVEVVLTATDTATVTVTETDIIEPVEAVEAADTMQAE